MFWKSGRELALWYLMSDGLPAGPPLGHALKISPITIVGAAWVGGWVGGKALNRIFFGHSIISVMKKKNMVKID